MEITKNEQESIKLEKNTKGYNWEIKLLGVVDGAQLERLAKLNGLMKASYELT